jgi:hypothetical protein
VRDDRTKTTLQSPLSVLLSVFQRHQNSIRAWVMGSWMRTKKHKTHVEVFQDCNGRLQFEHTSPITEVKREKFTCQFFIPMGDTGTCIAYLHLVAVVIGSHLPLGGCLFRYQSSANMTEPCLAKICGFQHPTAGRLHPVALPWSRCKSRVASTGLISRGRWPRPSYRRNER